MKKPVEWIDVALRFAGVVNVVWGLIFVLFTDPLFRWAKLPEPPLLLPWELIGAGAILFGLGYYVASFNVAKHALVVAIGFTIKVVGTVLVWKGVLVHEFTVPMALYFSAKDALWLIPFALVLYHLLDRWQSPEQDHANPTLPFAETIAHVRTNQGNTLRALSHGRPVLMVFLPNFLSPLFQSWVSQLAQQHSAVQQEGTQLVLVYAKNADTVGALRSVALAKAEFADDADHTLHSLFGLKKAPLAQLIAELPRKPLQAVNQWATGHYRVPGAFLLYRDELLKMYRHGGQEDCPDFAALAQVDRTETPAL
jgi:hypothetical protein